MSDHEHAAAAEVALSEDEREALAEALASSSDGCWDHEPCCWSSFEAIVPAVERLIAAHLAPVQAERDRLAAAEAILNGEQFTWLMVGDPDWAQAHVAAIRPAWHQWLSDRADERNRR